MFVLTDDDDDDARATGQCTHRTHRTARNARMHARNTGPKAR
ncbi:predicted protein [Plenodomus lingam JN3]|uniref:Predicted protein n=1 Tax=Leptosphaeria maculans (strain JN3 / isolate v23.1.3 / race Av1-4-5-6-7-8) TaxID=985895 RepID=E4ZJV5_LEPMJ|nr:predicted protein [Plenodomus lingam JN3]CBX91390.1 predicted protein [Plenodomus lingam JN3]